MGGIWRQLVAPARSDSGSAGARGTATTGHRVRSLFHPRDDPADVRADGRYFRDAAGVLLLSQLHRICAGPGAVQRRLCRAGELSGPADRSGIHRRVGRPLATRPLRWRPDGSGPGDRSAAERRLAGDALLPHRADRADDDHTDRRRAVLEAAARSEPWRVQPLDRPADRLARQARHGACRDLGRRRVAEHDLTSP